MTVPRAISNAATNQAAQPDTSIYITRFRALTDPKGESDSYANWTELCADLEANADQIASKSDGQGWSPVTFTGDTRAKKNVERVYCLVLDYDKGTTDMDAAFDFWSFEAFKSFRKHPFTTPCLVHTSFSHTPEHPKFRVILPLSRAVDVKEFEAIWKYVADLATKAGHELDGACKDPSRLWFWPACKLGDKVTFLIHDNPLDPVDVRRILKECGYKGRSIPRSSEATSSGRSPSAMRSFEQGLDEIRDAGEGSRNGTLNTVAFKAGMYVGGGRLDEDYARKELREAGLACGLDAAEVETTMLNALDRGKQNPSTGDWDERQEVKLSGELHENVQDAMKVLGQHPNLFVKDGRLVCIETSPTGGVQMIGVEDTRLQEMMSESAVWSAHTKVGKGYEKIGPPKKLAEALVKRGSWNGIKQLRAVTAFPILGASGHLRVSQGYDDKTRTFYVGNVEVGVPEAPTQEDARKAVATLLDIVCDFPFVNEAHKSAWLAALLSPLSRFMHEGNIPLVLVQANDRRVGKSLLAGLIARIVTGQSPAIMVHSEGDEERKRIGTVLLAGYPVVLIDNVENQFGAGGSMNALITSRVWVDRKLGKMAILRAENNATWIVNGKNITLAPDMAQRCLHIRLQCNEEKPELRSEFKHKDLEGMVLVRRGELLGAALTILRAYVLEGMPDHGLEAWGSFESWSKLIRGSLVWSGMPDPALTRKELEEEADTELPFEIGLVEGLDEAQRSLNEFTGLKAVDVHRHLERDPNVCPTLREALQPFAPRGQALPSAVKLGHLLGKVKRKVRNGKMIEPVPGARKKDPMLWKVVSVP